MRVLHLISSGGYYGAESMLLALAKAQLSAGVDVQLSVFRNTTAPNLELAERAHAQGVVVHELECAGPLDPSAIRALRRMTRTLRIDVLHTHGFKANVYAACVSRRRTYAQVATCHNWVGGTRRLAVYNWIDRKALRRADYVVAVSEPVAARAQAAGVDRRVVRRIPNGIAVDTFEAVPPATCPPTVLGVVARLDWSKGFDTLVDAIRILAPIHPALRVIVIGDGPDSAAIRAHVEAGGVAERFRFDGYRADMSAAYAELDIMVLPSRNEGLPMTLLEAMAVGRPVVASAVGGIPTLVTHEHTGLLVPPSDAHALAAGIDRMLRDGALRERLVTQARASIRMHHSSAAMAQRYLTVYHEALEARGAGRAPDPRTPASTPPY